MLSRTRICLARTAPLTLGRAMSMRVQAMAPAMATYSPTNAGVPSFLPHVARRFYTRRPVDEPAKVVDFKDVNEAISKKDDNLVVVDVREPDEFSHGHIPAAVNIPFRSSPGALGLDAAEFEDAFGFQKPSTNKTLLFYCQAGVRSQGAEQLAATYGYQHRLNYSGSYQDWVENNGKTETQESSADGKGASNSAA